MRLLSLLQPPGQVFRLTENLFLRLLGLVYLIAFASLYPQMIGLVGANGISPSLFWLFHSGSALQIICLLGCFAALLMMLGLAIRISAIGAYVLYLSLVTIGQPFTGFQWDSLLLETGFLAIFAGATWLAFGYRLLLFRLLFESGLVKLTSGDANWRNLHALRYHFFTQPLPTPLAYYMQHLPFWVLDALTFSTLVIELVIPFLLFARPRRLRQIAAAVLIFLQIFIALTGNYGFFNLLTIILCLWALDDNCLPKWLTRPVSPNPRFPRALNTAVACVILLSVLQVFGLEPAFLEPLEIVNPYGLFAVMTTSRIELVIEGSEDNIHWLPYSFRYKPGDPQRSLPLVAPYQPRLDWQMWFAALGSPQTNFWTKTLVFRLLRGEPTVLGLLEKSPFAKPPSQIRILAYSYTFASPSERGNGVIWNRHLLGLWFGPVSIDSIH